MVETVIAIFIGGPWHGHKAVIGGFAVTDPFDENPVSAGSHYFLDPAVDGPTYRWDGETDPDQFEDSKVPYFEVFTPE